MSTYTITKPVVTSIVEARRAQVAAEREESLRRDAVLARDPGFRGSSGYFDAGVALLEFRNGADPVRLRVPVKDLREWCRLSPSPAIGIEVAADGITLSAGRSRLRLLEAAPFRLEPDPIVVAADQTGQFQPVQVDVEARKRIRGLQRGVATEKKRIALARKLNEARQARQSGLHEYLKAKCLIAATDYATVLVQRRKLHGLRLAARRLLRRIPLLYPLRGRAFERAIYSGDLTPAVQFTETMLDEPLFAWADDALRAQYADLFADYARVRVRPGFNRKLAAPRLAICTAIVEAWCRYATAQGLEVECYGGPDVTLRWFGKVEDTSYQDARKAVRCWPARRADLMRNYRDAALRWRLFTTKASGHSRKVNVNQ